MPRTTKTKKAPVATPWWRRRPPLRRPLILAALLLVGGVAALGLIGPPTTPYILAEGLRRDVVPREVMSLEAMGPALPRAVVAAEDANFCRHWGFDMTQIRAALAEGGNRGASTLSQQTVKNVFLWQGRSWPRKAIEAALTPLVELLWTKERLLEVYLNVAEFDAGIFGAGAASRHYFGVPPGELTPGQAARLAAVLPNPRGRSAAEPTPALRQRATRIADGAATIARDGRDDCFLEASG